MARLYRFLVFAALILAIALGGGYAGLVYFARHGGQAAAPGGQPGASGGQAAAPGGQSEDEKSLLASVIERALSSPDMKISIGAVDGALSSDATIRDVVLADREGVWLRLDRARLIWSRSSLLLGRLIVDRLEIGHLELLRKPLPSNQPAAESAPAQEASASGGSQSLLPSLPVQVVVGAFSLADLSLGEDILGVAARLSGKGRASLGRPSDGLDLAVDLQRLDAPGALHLGLTFEPATNALKLAAAAHEPAGGLIVHAARLEGLPPLDLELNGDGTLDAFQSRLTFDAGALASVSGDARLDRRAADRALTLDLAGTIEKLLPPLLSPVFAGQTKVGGAVIFGDDGSTGVEKFQIVARQARLDMDGRLGADNALSGHVSMRSLGEDGHGARSGAAEIGAPELLADASGQLQAPRIDLRLHVADARAPIGRIGRLDASFSAYPDGPVTEPATRIDLAADASGDGLALAEKGLAQALGDHFGMTFRARAALDGDTDVSVARVDAASGEIGAVGRFGLHLIKGKVTFSLPELQRFAALSGQALSGAAKGEIALDGALRDRINGQVAITTEKLATGLDLADGLIGGKTEIKGGVSKLKDGFGFDGFTLTTRSLTMRLDGQASSVVANIQFSADAPDLARVSKDLAGRAQAQGRLTGSLAHPDAALNLAFTDMRSMGRTIPRLVLDIDAKDLVAALEARIGLDGLVGGKPATGALNLARRAEGGWRFKAASFRLGSVSLSGEGAISGDDLAAGSLDFDAGDLDDLTPLALQRLAGRARAKLSFDAAEGKQALSAVVKASGLRGVGFGVEKLDLDARVADLYGAPLIVGTASLDRANFGSESISRLRAVSRSGPGGSDFTLSGEARGTAFDSRGRLAGSAPLRLDLAAFDARGGGQKIALAGPARFSFPARSVVIDGLNLAAGAGRLSVNGSAGEKLDLTVSAKAMPVALVRIVAPDLAIGGTLDASARLGGSAASPSGDWRFDLLRLTAPQMRQAGLSSADIHASGRLEGGRTTLLAQTSLPRGGSLRVEGSAPLDPAGSLDLAIRGALDVGLANVALAASGRRVAGRLSIDLRAQGRANQPQMSGTASLAGGSFEDPLAGIKFDRIEALLRGRGEEITIERFTAATRGNGSVSVAGTVRVAPDAGFPASLRINGQSAELVSNDIVTAVADLALQLSGPLASRPKVSGRISFQSIDVRVPDRIPVSLRPLEDVVQVEPTPAARARLAVAEKTRRQRKAAAPAFNADLAVAVSAPSHIFVRGRGIDAELGGDLTLGGDLARPVANGAFQLRRGAFSIAGKRLDFTRGNIGFAGDVIPQLDFVAQSASSDVTAQIAITGPADQPVFTFSSTPELPQDEVISRLLFSSSSGSLTPIQSLQLAQTVAELSGQGGAGILEKMRRSLGVDSLNVQLGPDGAPRAGASRYIMRNVNVGIRTGAKPADNAVTLGVDVTNRLRVQGDAGADGSATVGVGAQWEY